METLKNRKQFSVSGQYQQAKNQPVIFILFSRQLWINSDTISGQGIPISIPFSFKLFRSLSANLIFNTAFFLNEFLADFVALVISSFLASETIVYVFFCLFCCICFWYSDILGANNKVIFRYPKQNCTSFLFRGDT